jgi:hypothetical protein
MGTERVTADEIARLRAHVGAPPEGRLTREQSLALLDALWGPIPAEALARAHARLAGEPASRSA